MLWTPISTITTKNAIIRGSAIRSSNPGTKSVATKAMLHVVSGSVASCHIRRKAAVLVAEVSSPRGKVRRGCVLLRERSVYTMASWCGVLAERGQYMHGIQYLSYSIPNSF